MVRPISKHFSLRLSLLPLFIFQLVAAVDSRAQAPPDPAILWSQTAIYRDEWGVPHIQADNLIAMSFAFGYAQAEDHIETDEALREIWEKCDREFIAFIDLFVDEWSRCLKPGGTRGGMQEW